MDWRLVNQDKRGWANYELGISLYIKKKYVFISRVKLMDSSMKGKIMTGMIVGAFLLALLAVIGSSWMTLDEDGVELNLSLIHI